jgi:hypothetical protein
MGRHATSGPCAVEDEVGNYIGTFESGLDVRDGLGGVGLCLPLSLVSGRIRFAGTGVLSGLA